MGQFGFSSVNPRFGTKKSNRGDLILANRHKYFFWAITKNTCPTILIETPKKNEI
jgi:hypothetical protein